MHTVLIIMHKTRVEFLVRDEISTIASGSDPLTMYNGDYDACLSSVVNHAVNFCPTNPNFIFRKA